MIRLSNIKLPLNHDETAIKKAVLSTLNIRKEQLLNIEIFKRGYDARKKTNIFLIYTLDIETTINDELLETFADSQFIKAAPDLTYYNVAQAPANLTERPVVIGFGPCGLLAGLVLAQMGYKPIILERGKEVRERTKDCLLYTSPSPRDS